MNQVTVMDESCIDQAVRVLEQILLLYKQMGPQSMASLTKSYLAPAPTAETATDAAEGMMAHAFDIFDAAVYSTLQAVADRQGYDLSAPTRTRSPMLSGWRSVRIPMWC